MAANVQMHSGEMHAAPPATIVSVNSNGAGHVSAVRSLVQTLASVQGVLLLIISSVVDWATALRACAPMHSGRTTAATVGSPA